VIEQRLISFGRGGDRGNLTLAGDSATGDSAGAYSPSESVEMSVNSVSQDVCECVDMRLWWLSRFVHAEGGDVVGRSWEGRSFEANEGPTTAALQASVVVPEHSEIGRMFVDTVHSDGVIACTAVVFRGARKREGDESRKIGT